MCLSPDSPTNEADGLGYTGEARRVNTGTRGSLSIYPYGESWNGVRVRYRLDGEHRSGTPSDNIEIVQLDLPKVCISDLNSLVHDLCSQPGGQNRKKRTLEYSGGGSAQKSPPRMTVGPTA